jgi:hypothetical protein
MTYETTDSDAQVRAAREALRTHDELRRVEQIGDQFELGPDELPVDGRGWLAWHDEQYQPAHREWTDAVDRLQSVLGDRFPGRHPLSFRTVCEQIITNSARTERLEWGVRGPSGRIWTFATTGPDRSREPERDTRAFAGATGLPLMCRRGDADWQRAGIAREGDVR